QKTTAPLPEQRYRFGTQGAETVRVRQAQYFPDEAGFAQTRGQVHGAAQLQGGFVAIRAESVQRLAVFQRANVMALRGPIRETLFPGNGAPGIGQGERLALR